MEVEELEGKNLGQKHRGYNTLLGKLITTHTVPEAISDDNDIKNLLRIDIASHNRDVEYILNVLKGNDMLYISRALSSCMWLVTDAQYANLINPNYLQAELYPNMTTKAIYKLKKHIRHHIKDESRAEAFYLAEKKKSDAIKWLPYCSAKFIEDNVDNHITANHDNPVTPNLFKRLCEKSITVFEVILNKLKYYDRQRYLQVVTFFLKTDIDKYLDVLESNDIRISHYGYPILNHKATELIIKHSPKRVFDNIEKYVSSIHIPTIVKYISADEVKDFLYAQANKDLQSTKYLSLRRLFQCDTLKYFIRKLPRNEQFDFAKTIGLLDLPSDAVPYRMNKICTMTNPEPYVWYQFAQFEHAFEEITKMIPLSANNYEKRTMLSLLIKCADNNLQHIQAILKYYLNKHRTDEITYKFQFIIDILTNTQIAKYDENTWNVFNELLTIMNVYEETPDQEINSEIINSIIIYNVLNDEKPPAVIEKKFSFNTLKSYKPKINQEQQKKLFSYLYEHSLSKVQNPITNEKNLTDTIDTLQNVLKSIQDWEKSFLDYPVVLNKIKELIRLKKKNSYKASLSSLYNINKSWKKYMFEESVELCPSEEVCLNALKHDPQVLTRHKEDVDSLITNDKVSLQRLLVKLRIYWPASLAQQWTENYMNNVKDTKTQKAAIRGLCIMLTQKPLLEMIEKFTPKDSKINWKEVDDSVLNIQRFLAKNMHLARPQPSPDAILSYAKGDYLQFALPSLLAIFYNLKTPMNKQYVPKLLNAPVSVQKHGIRLAFKTLDRSELKPIFLKCWQSSQNATIRTIIFKYTFKLLCSESDPANALSLWELLEMFIDNLTFKEDKATYELLSKVQDIPVNVRASFLVKSYNFLQKLVPTVDNSLVWSYKWYCVQLAEYVREVMDTMSSDFVLNLLQDFLENDFFKCSNKFERPIHHSQGIIRVVSAYLLHATNENDQIEKYVSVMVPLMQRSFGKWEEKHEGNFFVKRNFRHLLTRLSYDLKDYVAEKKTIIPVRMFSLIQAELEKSLSVPENYLILTDWKLTVTLAKLAKQYASPEKPWDENCGYEFGKICLDYLKTDVSLHFPCIYVLFSKSVKHIMYHLLPENTILQFYEGILSDTEFIEGYLSSIEVGAESCKNEKYQQIWNKVSVNPSVEVKMHYYTKIDTQVY